MKICILSMQRVQNFGSVLQSFALKQMLERLGHQVSFLDIEPRPEDDCLRAGKIQHFQDTGEKTRFFGKLKKIDKYILNRINNKRREALQRQKFEAFRRNALGMTENTATEQYDCCVIGSDEVFNCMSFSPWGFTSQLFGNVKQTRRVITYAASCGGTKLDAVPDPVKDRIRQTFEKVAAFSVRDKNTRWFVSQLTETPIQEHLDPAMVFDFHPVMDDTQLSAKMPPRYCVVYSYTNRIGNPEDISRIRAFCKKHDLKLVTLGSPQMWIREHLAVSPFEALKVFQNAQFVITDTFHGTIFSAKYAGKFAVMVRPSNENKLQDLIDKLELNQHQVSSWAELETAFAAENDRGRVEKVAQRERERTMAYLEQNVQGV